MVIYLLISIVMSFDRVQLTTKTFLKLIIYCFESKNMRTLFQFNFLYKFQSVSVHYLDTYLNLFSECFHLLFGHMEVEQ